MALGKSSSRVAGMTVVTRQLARSEGGRLVVPFLAGRSQGRPTMLFASELAARTEALGVRVEDVSILGSVASTPSPVEITGTLVHSSDYLRVLSRIPQLSDGRDTYFELRRPEGPVVMRIGYVEGVPARSRLVGWVSPDILRRW
jgi:hypothetical protein